MIKDRKELEIRGIEIDLSGPQGNAFVLLGYAQQYCKQLGYTKEQTDELIENMKSADYDNLVNVFDKAFGDFVIIYK
ncbi:MAG: hypothetical protein ACOC1O_00120 [bacterium]